MKIKKILTGLIVFMFLASMLPGIVGEQNAETHTYQERRFVEEKDLKGIYTINGVQKNLQARGKPGAYVTITNPTNGADLSGTVQITINSNYNPTITIDGASVESGLSYSWDTTSYSDGAHTIAASARGVTDTVTVTVSNGGGGNTAPTVTITNPNNGATVSGSITISVTAIDQEDGALPADIYIDGSLKTTGTSYNWDTTGYSDGTHTITAETTDSGRLSDTDQITVTVSNVGGDVNKYALVIGISDYEGTSSDLQYCDDDAQDWKNFLQGQGYSVTMLTDNQATANNIISAINNLIAAEDGDDYVVMAYSGHGSEMTGYGSCIVSHDLYGIDHEYVESLFAGAESSHIFFSFDACVIGDFEGLVTNNRVGAFASNRRNSYDGDSSMQNGVFTYYQMQGWNSYNVFEDDSAYAVQGMKAWPSSPRIKVDPFYVDQYSGDMQP